MVTMATLTMACSARWQPSTHTGTALAAAAASLRYSSTRSGEAHLVSRPTASSTTASSTTVVTATVATATVATAMVVTTMVATAIVRAATVGALTMAAIVSAAVVGGAGRTWRRRWRGGRGMRGPLSYRGRPRRCTRARRQSVSQSVTTTLLAGGPRPTR